MSITRRMGVGAGVLGLAAAFAGSPYRHQGGRMDIGRTVRAIEDGSDHVSALQLAVWIKARKPGLRVIDVRAAAEFGEDAIPTAENMPMERLVKTVFAPHETVVLYSEGGAHAGQAWVLLQALGVANAYYIAGGLVDWQEQVLSPVVGPEDGELAEVSRYFGGQPVVGDVGDAPVRMRRRGC
ncbi:hypothetical protein ABAC460_22800 [Asticcacaulis sp. AC460]|uniref:rhodanese-like domain-containing protein n=1 Tax=Asticcacaulis sp. AC460 TaxID=1282360 RepID=UPI0003C3EDD9|nr:rhodanese-like domain-containing protein [Asticcacaulis sp. AC460]ESQ86660.1 hypothetical protein ABAC460_22800 [Asticcacaulis sp. AC460]